jgi:DNA polymerase elongation subunit (family B)
MEEDEQRDFWNDISRTSNFVSEETWFDRKTSFYHSNYENITTECFKFITDWSRPSFLDDSFTLNSGKDDLIFSINTISYSIRPNEHQCKFTYSDLPVFRIFGTDQHGGDVLLNVHGFLPYFYIDSGFLEFYYQKTTEENVKEMCHRVKAILESLISERIKDSDRCGPYVHHVEVTHHVSCYGFQDEERPFFKITMISPNDIKHARAVVETGCLASEEFGYCEHTYESNLDFVVRFMSRLRIVGNGWVMIKAGNYSLRSCMRYPERLMGNSLRNDHEIPIELEKELERSSGPLNGLERTCYCNVESDTVWETLIPLDHTKPPWDVHAPRVNVSYDIEVINSTKQFPDPSNPLDRIISIAPYVTLSGNIPSTLNPVRFVGVFAMDDSDPIEALDVEERQESIDIYNTTQEKLEHVKNELRDASSQSEHANVDELIEKEKKLTKDLRVAEKRKRSYLEFPEPDPTIYCHTLEDVGGSADDLERSLILSYARWMRSVRPDSIMGWNIDRFDGSYIYKRAKYLGIADILNFGRIIGEKCRLRSITFQNTAYGKTEYEILTQSGCVDFDVFVVSKKDVSLSLKSYSLKSVSTYVLGYTKLDMPYEEIRPVYLSGPSGRAKVHRYCVQDSRLVWKILEKRGYEYAFIEQARATGVPLQYLCFRGVQIRILAKQLQYMGSRGMIFPNIRNDIDRIFRRGAYSRSKKTMKYGVVWNDKAENPKKATTTSAFKRTKAFDGATVIEPETGFHESCVGILDFASLYPSEILQHNISFDTCILDKNDRRRLRQGDDYWVSPSGAAFVLPHIREGVLPAILKELLKLRSLAKKKMREYESGSSQWAIYNGRQLGLKVTANSVYGASGTLMGALVNLDVAAAVTSSGREDLFRTRELVHEISSRKDEFGVDKHGKQTITCSMEIIYGGTRCFHSSLCITP